MSRSTFANYSLDVSSTSMTGTDTITSDPIDMSYTSLCEIQIKWTGTPAGNFKLQESSDEGMPTDRSDPGTANVSTWTDVGSSTQAAGGAAGDHCYDLSEWPSKWVRLSYTNSASTGTITSVRVTKKGSA